jgi:hypothetical protein
MSLSALLPRAFCLEIHRFAIGAESPEWFVGFSINPQANADDEPCVLLVQAAGKAMGIPVDGSLQAGDLMQKPSSGFPAGLTADSGPELGAMSLP